MFILVNWGRVVNFLFQSLALYLLHLLNLFMLIYGSPSHHISINGSRYCISVVDAYTRYTCIYFLKLKSEANTVFQTFYNHIQVQFNHKIKALQIDGEGNFDHYKLSSNSWYTPSSFVSSYF